MSTFLQKAKDSSYLVKYDEKISYHAFYLATQRLAENMYKSVKKAINHYVEQNRQEFKNIQMTETDIEIDMGDGVKVNSNTTTEG